MTADWLARVKAEPGSRDEYLDTKETGLGLRVTRGLQGDRISKTWYVLYRVKGSLKLRRLTLGKYPDISLSAARTAAKNALAVAGQGQDPAAPLLAHKAAPTIRDLGEAFIEQHAKVKKRSWLKDEQALQRDVYPAWGHRKAQDVSRRDVGHLLQQKRKDTPVQANRLLALIRKMFNWGISHGYVDVNPCYRIEMPSAESARDRVLSDDELRALWSAMAQTRGNVPHVFAVRILTAQRGGEVCKMRWEHLDLDEGWWSLPGEFTKNKMPHLVPLTAPVVAILRELAARRSASDGGWVFRGRRLGRPYSNLGHATDALRTLSGLEFKPHDLRRTAATLMGRAGTSRFIIEKVLNHKDASVTGVYDRWDYAKEKRAALEALAALLETILGQPLLAGVTRRGVEE
jgi:integrase